MGQAWDRLQKQRQAKAKLLELMRKADQVIVIHYSCESFYDRHDGSSPRITSIAVRNLHSGQTNSFSIHQVAEREKLLDISLNENYDELEKIMLDEFYDYVKRHESCIWLHWNMRDINYGFPAIAHRYKVLKGNPQEIHESKLVDLSQTLIAMYGENYVSHPRLQNLLEINSLLHKDFLKGQAEAEAFVKGEYVKLHQSTLRKVKSLSQIAEFAAQGSLKVESKLRYYNFTVLAELIKEHPVIVTSLAISSLLAVVFKAVDFVGFVLKMFNQSNS